MVLLGVVSNLHAHSNLRTAQTRDEGGILKICTVFNYPTANFGPQHARLAERFVSSYRENPPLMDHMMVVVSNGGPPNGQAVSQFSFIEGTKFLHRENVGQDIGSYQFAAEKVICDLMVFFGGASYFRGPGWLRRMASVYQSLGDGLYGCTGNQGDRRFNVWPHVRTTAFWCNPKLVNENPFKCNDNSERYAWEHGERCLTSYALSKGKPAYIVGWNEIRALAECDSLPGGYHNGTQHNLLVGDTLTSPPYYPHA